MSGGFDLTVIVEGKTMKEVALFVAEKLSTLESVLSTSTHFVLKKYKDKELFLKRNKKMTGRQLCYEYCRNGFATVRQVLLQGSGSFLIW